ncbi:MAG: ABC transporter permease subunit [Proteobacteria bacterium]|nr:ABC transporter permease subunit [Pseudomonadota bacterium]
MTSYFIRRLLLVIPTFLGITLLVFVITRFVPGGPVDKILSESQRMSMSESGTPGGSQQSSQNTSPLSEEQIQELKEFYGFDKPVLVSYFEWLFKILKFDLGISTRYYDPVWEIIKDKLPVSIYYGVVTTILTYIICIPLGILKAIKHKTYVDNTSSVLILVGYALPGFIVAIILFVWPAARWDWFPLGGFVSEEFEDLIFIDQVWDVIYHSILPMIAYMIGGLATMTFLMKNTLMDNLSADYVRTAIAKGKSFRGAVFGHAFRNSIIPLATHFGNNISMFLAGSFLIEKVFNIDGLGLLGFESLVERDYPIVLGVLVISSILGLLGNILSDLCVALVDPRVKFE